MSFLLRMEKYMVERHIGNVTLIMGDNNVLNYNEIV